MEKKTNPILEVSCEFRFETTFPQDAAYAMLLKCFSDSDTGKDFSAISQPVLNLPSDIRLTDPNLKYAPCYILSNEFSSIGISSFSLMYTIKKDYRGFQNFKQFIDKKNTLIKDNIKNVKRIALRYINRIDDSLLDATNLNLSTRKGGSTVKDQNFTLNIEENKEDNYATILRLNNLNTSLAGDAEKKKFSVIDIVAVNKQMLPNFDSIDNVLTKLNAFSEDIFKSLFKKEYIQTHYDVQLEW